MGGTSPSLDSPDENVSKQWSVAFAVAIHLFPLLLPLDTTKTAADFILHCGKGLFVSTGKSTFQITTAKQDIVRCFVCLMYYNGRREETLSSQDDDKEAIKE